MKVSELLELLRSTDPEARVMFMPPGGDEQDAQEVRNIFSSDVRWTHESGVDKGRQYEFLYMGEPHRELRTDCENVTYERVMVVLLAADEATLHLDASVKSVANHRHTGQSSILAEKSSL
jgi:hypothetical protein